MNGDDDDTSATMGGTDMGGGMYDTPDPVPVAEPDDDDLIRKIKRRTQRPRFRSTRQARRTTRKRR